MEKKLLEGWKLKLTIIMGIVTPTITATGAYYKLENKVTTTEAAVTARISSVELQTEKNKADKDALLELSREVRGVREDLVEIKTLLKQR